MGVFKGRSLFRFFGGASRREEFLARYVLREHGRGRLLEEIMADPYVRNRSTPEGRARLLERPDVVAALGHNAIEEVRRAARAGA